MKFVLIIIKNTFEWDKKLFTQQDCTAIGTVAAPPFAGLFMGELEEKAFEAWSKQDLETLPQDWWRFLDDILFWWMGTEQELLVFPVFINTVHPAIKLTWEFDFTI